jgi:hypothetical protein
VYHFNVQEDGTTSCATTNETTKKKLFYYNHDYSTLIVLGDVASSSNVAKFDNFYSAFDNQQPKIDVPIINLTYFLGTKSSPLGFPPKLFGIDAPILFPPLDVLAPKTQKK